jgi:hypothetical protein
MSIHYRLAADNYENHLGQISNRDSRSRKSEGGYPARDNC